MIFKAMREKNSPSPWAIVGLVAALLLVIGVTFVPAAAFSAPKLVVFGDSLVAGYQLPQGKGFVGQLQKKLSERGLDLKVIGAGVSGDTTSGGLARLDWSVTPDTDAVILELGANDALRGLPPAKTRANLSAMLARLNERNIPVLLAGMLAPPNMGQAYGDQFNPIYPELAEKHGAILYPFFLDGVAAEPSLNLSDGIHPNEKGVAIIVERILPSVERLLSKVTATASTN